MKKVLIVLSLILLGSMLFKNSSLIPQFTDEQIKIICIQEEI